MDCVRDLEFMGEAVAEAQQALDKGELPVGAVLVLGDQVVARAGAADRRLGNRVSHAEIRLLAGSRLSAYDRRSLTLYTTLEPCVMCTAAILIEGLGRVVYGLSAASVDGGLFLLGDNTIVERCGGTVLEVTGPVREGDCRRLMVEFAGLASAPAGMVDFALAILAGTRD